MKLNRSLFVVACLVLSCSCAHAIFLQVNGAPVPYDPNLALWLDASDIATLYQDTAGLTGVTAGGQAVARWESKSPNGIIVTQNSAGNRPSYTASVGNLNAQPTVSFVGGNGGDALTAMTGNSTGILGNDDRTVITVWSNATPTGQNYQHTFHMGDAVGNMAYGHSAYRSGGGAIGNHYWGAGYDTTAAGSASPTVALSMWDGDGGTGANGLDSWWVNGTPSGASDRGALNTGTGQLQIGSRLSPFTEGFTGDLAEVIVYDSMLTPTEMNRLGGYLQTKYGITILNADTNPGPPPPPPPLPPPHLGGIHSFPDFTDVSGWELNGTAAQAGDRLRLTTSGGGQAGSAFIDGRVMLDYDFSFNAEFAFAISNGSGDGADGLALVLHNSAAGPDALGTSGGGVGLSGIANSLGIVVKDYQVSEIEIRRGVDNTVLDQVTIGDANYLEDGVTRYLWVDYDGSTDLMSIYFAESDVKPDLAALISSIDLEAFMGGERAIYVGFTGGTGGEFATHDILSFRFVGVPEPTTLLLLGAGLAAVARRRRRA